MMFPKEIVLTVVLTQDEGDGEGFRSDVCRMLECIVERGGAALDTIDRRSPDFSRRMKVDARQLAALAREVGVHRAQIVPRGSTTGRVVTNKVTVGLTPGPGSSTNDTIVKTYNYPMRNVLRHSTGQIADLDDVLAGHP